MTTPLDQTRAEFEAWHAREHYPLDAADWMPDGSPRVPAVQERWTIFGEAWQAAIASRAAPETPAMPETWHVVAHVHGEPILSIGYDWLSGKELDEAEEQAVIGMAQHLLAFVGYGLPPSDFAPDDGTPPIAAKAAKETT